MHVRNHKEYQVYGNAADKIISNIWCTAICLGELKYQQYPATDIMIAIILKQQYV